jgi:uncharacterized membrane protein YhaH (DUF805 family)
MKYFIAGLKKYADFNGRANRSEFWYFYLFFILIVYGFIILGAVLNAPIISGIGSLAILAMLLPYIGVACRRMHDNDKSGWYILIPFYNLYLFIIEGTRGTNQYGPDPNAPDNFDFENKVL